MAFSFPTRMLVWPTMISPRHLSVQWRLMSHIRTRYLDPIWNNGSLKGAIRLSNVRTVPQNFILYTTHLTNVTDFEARNIYNNTVNEAKEISTNTCEVRSLRVPMVVLQFGYSPSTWTIYDSRFFPLAIDDGSIITSSKKNAEIFAKTFSANSTRL